MTWLPRTLFGRLALLVFALVAASGIAVTGVIVDNRVAFVAREFAQVKLPQLQAIQRAVTNADSETRLRTIAEQQGFALRDAAPGWRERAPSAMFARHLALAWRPVFGEDVDVALTVQGEASRLWVWLPAGERRVWVGVPYAGSVAAFPWRIVVGGLLVVMLLIVGCFYFARRISGPLSRLHAAAEAVGAGRPLPALPREGPIEVSSLATAFTNMAENLARLESERTLLLAGVSHDLRTPLTRLRLAIDVADIDPPLAQRMIANIEEIDRTIGQFLDFARGEDSLQRESCAINALVERVAARYTLHGARIALDLQPLPEIAAHEPTLERALANLIDNALRYAGPEREIVLATRTEPGRIVIGVGDRGPGIPASQRERVKQAFVRLDAARGGATGAGLGLSIVERIARAHGGTLTLTEREGGGTLAEISLPLDQSAARMGA